MIYYSLFV